MKLGDLIIQYRQQNGMSQREFARRAELSNSLISIIEKGINPQTGKEMSPDLETYHRIAMAMGTSMQTLFEQLGDDATVRLTVLHKNGDVDYIGDRPHTDEARILAAGIDKLPKAQREQALAMFKVMFAPQYADLFNKENDDDT